MANRVVINICGEELTFIAEESSSYMQRVGAYVNDKMAEVLDSSKVGRTDAAVLTAVNIADELFKAQAAAEQLRGQIKGYLDGLVAEAKEKGYVTTMFGRRRPVPELSSSNFMQRSFGERVAMNSPIQGTAADIIKIAMIRVHDRLLKENLKSRLILTVHDELLVETAIEEEDAVRKILEEEMHGAADLAVTLEIDAHVGKNWYEAK